MNKIKVEVVSRAKNWFVKVKSVAVPTGTATLVCPDDVLIGTGFFGKPSPHCARLRFTTRRALRDAVRKYNSINDYPGFGHKIIGGLH